MGEFVVAAESEVPEGGAKCASAGGVALALFKQGGKIFALTNTCPHKGGPLCDGEVDGKLVACPLHGYQYDVTNGNCETNPALKAKTFPTRVENGQVKVTV